MDFSLPSDLNVSSGDVSGSTQDRKSIQPSFENSLFFTVALQSLQCNLDYLDSLGLDEIVRIIEVRIIRNMNINEEEN